MTIKLRHCTLTFMKVPGHPCAHVRRELDRAGIGYEIVKHPLLPRSRRTRLRELSGQDLLPVIQFEDGTVYRAESQDMAARIKAGKLFEGGDTAA